MSTLAIVLIVIAAVLLLLFAGGYAASHRRRFSIRTHHAIARADRALAEAAASDRGWNRQVLVSAAGRALGEQRPGFEWERLDLVLVDDRPGVAEDRALMRASGAAGEALVVLSRTSEGDWAPERIE